MDTSDAARLRWLCDRAEIVDAVLRFALAMDLHDWAMLRACLADEVETDYRAFRGEPVGVVRADEFVAKRAANLADLGTQHVITNPLVEIDGDGAVCRSCFLIHRVHPALPDGENTLDSAGHYVHRLARTDGRWRITAIAQTPLWTRGNPAVHGAFRPPDGER